MLVTSGVPQDSLLGPLLFFIYVNDLPKQIKECKAFGYAGDCKLLSSKTDSILKHMLNIEMGCSKIEMKLNEGKCHILPVKTHENKERTLNFKCLITTPKLSWQLNAHKDAQTHGKPFTSSREMCHHYRGK